MNKSIETWLLSVILTVLVVNCQISVIHGQNGEKSVDLVMPGNEVKTC